jgi:hypothetical protein
MVNPQTLLATVNHIHRAGKARPYAERSGDMFHRMARRATHANALHQAGGWDEADARFREAEEMQAWDQPKYALLYSLRGFQ